MNPLAENADQMMPPVPFVILMVTVVLMAGVLVLMGVLGAQRRIKPNEFFGIRTAYTRSGEFAWYTVHEVSARWSIVAGLVCLPSLVLLPIATTPNGQIAALLVPMGISVTLLVLGSWRAHKVTRERQAREAGRADLP
ncbi:SdpI family protein [Nocardiopsis exhalans]|uniref:SdpI family protein n=1 Tax=Nocardiopsis exhalans TaxID=163604 RepID=A0ABY5D6T4_9ACTN|nr:SdpI family protein [Nocardiopsis exhalans]USY18938.1 SdpI family protein [Nocardiopsis exhalans]